MCRNCSKPAIGIKLLKCARCQQAYYCSKECQKIDWKSGHKTVCEPPDKALKLAKGDKQNACVGRQDLKTQQARLVTEYSTLTGNIRREFHLCFFHATLSYIVRIHKRACCFRSRAVVQHINTVWPTLRRYCCGSFNPFLLFTYELVCVLTFFVSSHRLPR